MQEGTIVRLKDGYGFIKIEGAPDLFFHAKELVDVSFDSLKEGDKVSFEAAQSADGRPNAVKVSKAA